MEASKKAVVKDPYYVAKSSKVMFMISERLVESGKLNEGRDALCECRRLYKEIDPQYDGVSKIQIEDFEKSTGSTPYFW